MSPVQAQTRQGDAKRKNHPIGWFFLFVVTGQNYNSVKNAEIDALLY